MYVTGGSSGIGKEVAREALKLGANVTIVARNTEKLQTALIDLKKWGSNVAMLSIDVSDSDMSCEQIRQNLQDTIESFGPVKVIFKKVHLLNKQIIQYLLWTWEKVIK